MRRACAVAWAALTVAGGCSRAVPAPLPRVVAASPSGLVPPDEVTVELTFSAPVDRRGLEEGRLLVLCRREDLRDVVQAAASDPGASGAPLVPARVAVSADGLRAALRPERPLEPGQPWAAVLSPRLRAVDGRPVLDPEGRSRAFAVLFDTGPAADRTAPAPRWLHPPHGPAPANLAWIRIGFDEPVSGAVALQEPRVATSPLEAAGDALGLALEAPPGPGLLRLDLAGVHDAAGNAAAPLAPLEVSRCASDASPRIGSVTVEAGALAVRIQAELSAMGSLVAEASALPGEPACGTAPAAPATLRIAADVLPCAGWDPCAPVSSCPGVVELSGLCPGRTVRVRLAAEDLAGHEAAPGPWREVASLPPVPSPVVTEVLADADAPEAGGEYVELANVGTGDLDAAGLALAKHTAAGRVLRCAIASGAGPVPPGAHALVVGGAYDGRYELPEGTVLYRCGATALAGGLANDRPVALALEDASGRVLSSAGLGGEVARCAEGALERIHPSGPDVPENWACPGARTPAACNRSTPPAECPRRPW